MPSAAKQLLREALDQVPDDATVEDVMERLYFLAKVARGLDAAERGDLLPHDEIEREFLAGDLDRPLWGWATLSEDTLFHYPARTRRAPTTRRRFSSTMGVGEGYFCTTRRPGR